MIFSGNVEPNEAESMIQHIEDVLFKSPQRISQSLFPSQHLTNRVIKLERGVSYFYPAEGLNPSDENSALVHYIQVCTQILGKSRFALVCCSEVCASDCEQS